MDQYFCSKLQIQISVWAFIEFSPNCQLKRKTSIGYFQQGNAAAHTADKRLHGYYIQKVFKQNN